MGNCQLCYHLLSMESDGWPALVQGVDEIVGRWGMSCVFMSWLKTFEGADNPNWQSISLSVCARFIVGNDCLTISSRSGNWIVWIFQVSISEPKDMRCRVSCLVERFQIALSVYQKSWSDTSFTMELFQPCWAGWAPPSTSRWSCEPKGYRWV